MIISRSIAKARIARGQRPGFLAAWVPVLLDAAAFVLVAALVWPFLRDAMAGLSVAASAAVLMLVYFLPSQAVVIVSALWATKSRWQDGDGDA